jgi:hypothetical protein
MAPTPFRRRKTARTARSVALLQAGLALAGPRSSRRRRRRGPGRLIAALGLAAAGHNPRDVCRGTRSVAAYVRSHASGIRDLGSVQRTVLVLRASGLNPRRLAGRDLLARLRAERRT